MTHRRTARLVGVLFILATVHFSLSVGLLAPVLEAPDFLVSVSQNSGRVGIGILLELVNHIAVVAIAVVIYPVLRSFSERLALGYVAARSIEAALFAVATLHLLTLVSVSRDFSAADAQSSAALQVLGDTLVAGHDWNKAALPFTVFGIGALMLNWALWTARLVPRWIAAFGLMSATSILTARLLLIGSVELPPATVVVMDGPIFLQEMVLAVWLIFKGFSLSGLRAASVEAEKGDHV